LDNQLRTELIRLFCGYQRLSTRAGRDAWLTSLPLPVRNLISRRDDNCRTDLAFICDAVYDKQLQDGRWPLLILIEDVLSDVEGTVLSKKLSVLHQRIQSSLGASPGLDISPAYEEIVIGGDERVGISFLEDALEAAKAVARIEMPRTIGGKVRGTGWLISPDLLITNHHVIEAREPLESPATPDEMKKQAKASILWFGYDFGSFTEYRCLDLIYANEALDYAVLRISSTSVDGVSLSDWGFLKVVSLQQNLDRGTRINVIQHPGGRFKEIALRTNFYIGCDASSSRFHYLSDTEGGSSGSPVLNDDWQVVGLHHAWDYYEKHYKGQPIRFNSLGLQYAAPSKFLDQSVATINEGILIHSVIRHYRSLTVMGA
jgi:endonuclease G